MTSELSFQGKKITDRERLILEQVFGEKIDDLYFCQSVLLAAMRPENVLARGAFTRALTHKYCSYTDGGREARKLIRQVRHKIGYSLTFADRRRGFARSLRNLRRTLKESGDVRRALSDVLGMLWYILMVW